MLQTFFLPVSQNDADAYKKLGVVSSSENIMFVAYDLLTMSVYNYSGHINQVVVTGTAQVGCRWHQGTLERNCRNV
jgi:hypothetical protein